MLSQHPLDGLFNQDGRAPVRGASTVRGGLRFRHSPLQPVPQLTAYCCTGNGAPARLAKRVVVALDVRSNDAGDLVVTKGMLDIHFASPWPSSEDSGCCCRVTVRAYCFRHAWPLVGRPARRADGRQQHLRQPAKTRLADVSLIHAARGSGRFLACLSAGDQYDVREGGTGSGGDVRNLGKPVSLAERYFRDGADEVSFLNITGFRDFPLEDLPMLEACCCPLPMQPCCC